MPDSISATTQDATAAAPDFARYRHHFPALKVEQNHEPVVYFDNPAGTQVPQSCIDGIVSYLTSSNANTHGAFLTSARTDTLLDNVHQAMADFLNAADPREIAFGPNMTTMTFAFSRALGRTLQPGDEIVVTALDHDANVAPWLALAEDRGAILRTVQLDPATCTLDMADLHSKITARTKIVAVGYASNATGTINDVATAIRLAREVGAYSYIDAVHYGPHGPIDVQALGCDFLICSAYKFFAPHLGILYGRLPHMETLRAYKVRPASDEPPVKWETGTLNHECLAGLLGTLEYLSLVGRDNLDRYATRFPTMTGRQLELHTAMAAIQEHERTLSARMLAGFADIPGIHVYGLTKSDDLTRRVPTFAVTIDGYSPRQLAEELGKRGIFTWDGNYYALSLTERLGLEDSGGMLRIGLVHYNVHHEIDRFFAALHEIVAS